MLREFLNSLGGAGLYALPLVAMGIFLAMFVAVLVRTSQKARAPEYRRMADLPLQDDIKGSNLS
jgi:cbb3-type cytochrome oxidase subunit 3